jgi:hypothetical protein
MNKNLKGLVAKLSGNEVIALVNKYGAGATKNGQEVSLTDLLLAASKMEGASAEAISFPAASAITT